MTEHRQALPGGSRGVPANQARLRTVPAVPTGAFPGKPGNPASQKPRRNLKRLRTMPLTVGELRNLIVPRPLTGNVRLGPEESGSVEIANWLREITLNGRLHAMWMHTPNEMAGGTRTAKLRHAKALNMGMIPGWPDYTFFPQGPAVLCEYKVGKGRQNDNQISVQRWAQDTGLHYHLFRSREELEEILIKERVLTA